MTRGDNSGKTRNMRRLFFHEESIHEVSRRYLEHEYVHTYIRTYICTYIRTSRNQYVPYFFKVGGIINMHADILAQADMSVLKKYGQKRPDRDVPRMYVSGRNDLEPNCSFTNFM